MLSEDRRSNACNDRGPHETKIVKTFYFCLKLLCAQYLQFCFKKGISSDTETYLNFLEQVKAIFPFIKSLFELAPLDYNDCNGRNSMI